MPDFSMPRGVPAFCLDCDKLPDCRQAENMTADTVPVDGYILDNGSVVCGECKGCGDEKALPIASGEEFDCPQHCECCGVPLIHALTSDGVEYVREHLQDRDGCCRELWPAVWADYLDDEDGTERLSCHEEFSRCLDAYVADIKRDLEVVLSETQKWAKQEADNIDAAAVYWGRDSFWFIVAHKDAYNPCALSQRLSAFDASVSNLLCTRLGCCEIPGPINPSSELYMLRAYPSRQESNDGRSETE